MNKKKIIITVSSIALLGAGVGVFMYLRKKKKEEVQRGELGGDTQDKIIDTGGGMGAVDDSEYSTTNKASGDNFPLKLGDNGRKVAMLQAVLNEVDEAGLKIDGAFGNATRTALAKRGYGGCVTVPGGSISPSVMGINWLWGKATTCEVTKVDLGEIMKELKSQANFKKKYYSKNNNDINKVYAKYKS